jgi:hypothetical protein
MPEVVDFTLITNAAGLGAIFLTMAGAALRFDADRLARLTLLGTVVGGGIGTVLFATGVVIEVL